MIFTEELRLKPSLHKLIYEYSLDSFDGLFSDVTKAMREYIIIHDMRKDKTMRFSEKVRKAERKWVEGGIYICPNCDGDNPLCDDDYQSQECEIHQAERLEDEEHTIMESFRMKKDGKQNKYTLIFDEGV